MTPVGFEPTIPALERAKTVHALDRAATVIGTYRLSQTVILCTVKQCSIFTRQLPLYDISTTEENNDQRYFHTVSSVCMAWTGATTLFQQLKMSVQQKMVAG
jgi:hypothetical protein